MLYTTLRRALSLPALLRLLLLLLLPPPLLPNSLLKRMVQTPRMTCPILRPRLSISIRGLIVPCLQATPVLFSGHKADLLLLVAQLLVACQVRPSRIGH